jgi:hypothetical protein
MTVDSTADVKHSSNCTSSLPTETEVMVSKIKNKPMSNQKHMNDSYDNGSFTLLPAKKTSALGRGITRNFFSEGGSTNSVEDRRQTEWGLGVVDP